MCLRWILISLHPHLIGYGMQLSSTQIMLVVVYPIFVGKTTHMNVLFVINVKIHMLLN